MPRNLLAYTLLALAAFFFPTSSSRAESPQILTIGDIKLTSNYPVKKNIITTFFWIGQGSTGYNDTTNYASAWDERWTKNFGGVDSPDKRVAGQAGTVTLPTKFAPTMNPYYVALPFNDVKFPKLAKKFVPWWDETAHQKSPYQSQCKGRWVMIEHDGKVCFAQWEDVGPFRYDHADYVFGTDRPATYTKAGLDVSPAVRDYLGLSGMDKTNWRFVEDGEVPYGPWIEYAEQAILFSAIKSEPQPQPLN